MFVYPFRAALISVSGHRRRDGILTKRDAKEEDEDDGDDDDEKK